MINGMGESMAIVWAGYGLRIENWNETQESLTIYISVPKHSYNLSADKNEMAGDYLAKRFKTIMTGMGVKRLIVKYKIRNEDWTPEKTKEAKLEMRKMIYGSQY